ncbi:glycosyltransferase family 2 protein [Arenibacter certesii]|uniref:Glycosyl transferase n=1 Tax=Arenibacter certesii TaxID=228955 RepID=A0A918ILF8_9FLAO|nr:glycosyltransferase family 2 protein [Arenibacter certesii]GGW22053.1 glycosyl transferase [Arenibacter certesii]
MFSIIIPLYNKELSIYNTIQSVLNQTFEEFEIVIVNDGSTDKSVNIVEGFKDKRIRLIPQKNQGVSAARNTGIKEAKYEWIAFLDADDLWMAHHLETLKKMIIVYPYLKVFSTSYILSNKTLPRKEDNSILVIKDYFKEVFKFHFFWTSVTCIHNSVFNSIGTFNINLSRGEDLELWARIGRKYEFGRSKRITAIYRMDAENKISVGKSKYNKSFLSVINLNGTYGYERRYLKKLLFQRIKTNIKTYDLKGLINIVVKQKFELFK